MALTDSSDEFDIFLKLLDEDSVREIGVGAYSTVYLGINSETSEHYAIKKIYKEKITTSGQLKHLCRESRILENNSSPYLLKLLGKFETEDFLVLVTEYAAGGDLFELYAKLPTHQFTEDQVRVYGAEIVHALVDLHNRGIIHRDIKQENILIDEDGHLKLADFGLSKDEVDEDNKATSFCGSPCSMAPEVVIGNEYDFSADWWSFGVLLYEMLCGNLPFKDDNHNVIYEEILHKNPEFPKTLSFEAKDLLENLLEKNPDKRLGSGPQRVEKILNHPFFDKIDWQKVAERTIEVPFKIINSTNDENL